MNIKNRRSISTSVVAVIVVVIVIVAGLAYIVAKYGSSAAPPGTSAPRPPPASLLSQYLGGSWTLNESESGVAYINASSGTVTVKLLNGTTTTVPLFQYETQVELPTSAPGELLQVAEYTYTGTVSSQPYMLIIIMYGLANSTVASSLFNNISSQAEQSNVTSATVGGHPALYVVTPLGAVAVMLKDSYLVYVVSNITNSTVSSSSWANLLSGVLDYTP